ncbi:hypothetical protein [Nocardioides sp. HB32]
MEDEIYTSADAEAEEYAGGWQHLCGIYCDGDVLDIYTVGLDRAQVEAEGHALGDRLEAAPESLLRHMFANGRGWMSAEDAATYLDMAPAFEAAELPPPSPDKSKRHATRPPTGHLSGASLYFVSWPRGTAAPPAATRSPSSRPPPGR